MRFKSGYETTGRNLIDLQIDVDPCPVHWDMGEVSIPSRSSHAYADGAVLQDHYGLSCCVTLEKLCISVVFVADAMAMDLAGISKGLINMITHCPLNMSHLTIQIFYGKQDLITNRSCFEGILWEAIDALLVPRLALRDVTLRLWDVNDLDGDGETSSNTSYPFSEEIDLLGKRLSCLKTKGVLRICLGL